MSSLSQTIRDTLSAGDANTKKQISIFIELQMLEKLDRIAKEFSRLNEAKNFSRNTIIEMALSELIKESAAVLKNDYGIDIEDDEVEYENEEDGNLFEDFNLAIYPARNEGFNKVFLGENSWWSVRINQSKIDQIKYVACYRATPVSGITHYAKVQRIEPNGDGKYRLIFDGEAIELPNVVKLGDTNANAMRSPRYTTLDRLLSASVVSDLFQ